jgi:hypothetical protein
MDIIGKIHPHVLRKHNYIFVEKHYFTKWVKFIPFCSINKETMIKLIKKQIIHIFGLLKTITTHTIVLLCLIKCGSSINHLTLILNIHKLVIYNYKA